MKYEKEYLSFEEQADLLISRGLECEREALIKKLESVNYYRLSGYLFPFRQKNSDHFYPGTKLSVVWNRYRFDRQLRFLVLDGIERIEVALKTDIAYEFNSKYGPFGYLEKENLPLMKDDRHITMIKSIDHETKRSKDMFVKHFFEKYGDSHDFLPLWMAIEVMSFGTILSFFRGLPTTIKQEISSKYNIHDKVLESWITSLNAVRNICAHHSRLWNRELGYKPIIPVKNNNWNTPFRIENNRVFVILSIINYMLGIIIPSSKWTERLGTLLNNFPEIPLKDMGFPDNWEKHKVWKK
jgi:abortive infection bacteriophage resistance protein